MKALVAGEVGRITKGELVDFVDYYCSIAKPELTVKEQQMLLTELWNWREEYAPFAGRF